MSDEKPPSSWTPEIVRDHVLAVLASHDRRYEELRAASDKAVREALAAQEKAVSAALAASEKAVLVAENNAEKWRANANEWRSAMNDRERDFVRRNELEAAKDRIEKLEYRGSNYESRTEGKSMGMRDMYGWVFGAVMLIIAVAGFALSNKL